LAKIVNQFKKSALRKLYGEGITGQGTPISGNKMGLGFIEQLSKEVPQTKAALSAYRAELERIQDLVSTRGGDELASVAIAQELLRVNTQLRDIEQDRMEIAAGMNRELSAQVQGALSRSQGTKPNPFGITDDQVNSTHGPEGPGLCTRIRRH